MSFPFTSSVIPKLNFLGSSIEDANMHLEIGPGIVQQLKQGLLIACFTLSAIFALRLYNARARFTRLKRRGLVRTHLFDLAMVHDRAMH